jgi:hypothetical protein
MVRRYVQTHAIGEREGRHQYSAHNYDGMVNPGGAHSGIENAKSRYVSPAARRVGT